MFDGCVGAILHVCIELDYPIINGPIYLYLILCCLKNVGFMQLLNE
jgi:hypothetical protein